MYHFKLEKINLYISLYKIENDQRLQEILNCLSLNISNKFISKIFILNEGLQNKILFHPKIELIDVIARPMFSDYFNILIDNEYNIIANNDIYFDKSLGYLKFLFIQKKDLLSLTRIEADGLLNNKKVGDSQDAWFFLGKPSCLLDCNFNQGFLGCDTRLNHIFFQNGFRVLNPSKFIKIFHSHLSEIRTYSQDQRIIGAYLLTKPIGFLHFHFFRVVLIYLRRQSILDVNHP
jgi:hypothetical protein